MSKLNNMKFLSDIEGSSPKKTKATEDNEALINEIDQDAFDDAFD